MPIIMPDLSETQSFVIEPGTYPATIKEIKDHTAKSGASGIDVVTAVEYQGKTYTRTTWIGVTGKGAFKFEGLLRAAKQDELANRIKASPKTPVDTDVLLGAAVQVVIDHELYNGENRDRVISFLKA